MSYELLARYYDIFQSPAELEAELARLELDIELFLPADLRRNKVLNIADLGCGTGNLALALAVKYSVWALDASEAMLALVKQKLERSQREGKQLRLNYSCQHISRFTLPGKQQLLLCLTDTLNHLPPCELPQFFTCASQHLQRGALLIFDVLRREFLAEERGDKCFYYEHGQTVVAEEGVALPRSLNIEVEAQLAVVGELPSSTEPTFTMVWQNSWDEDAGVARADFTFYERQGTLYKRSLDRIEEYYHAPACLQELWSPYFTLRQQEENRERYRFILQKN